MDVACLAAMIFVSQISATSVKAFPVKTRNNGTWSNGIKLVHIGVIGQ
jgi:hypothetical protein